jgi:alpha-L-fucosidase
MNTPYGKDVLKMLSEACEKHGMLLSIYYSCPDWHHPAGYNSKSTHQWKAKNQNGEVDHGEYLKYVKGQITELLTGYGRIYTFFWDIPPRLSIPEMNELVRKLQPGIYINNRGYGEGDFSTPERDETPIGYSRFTRMTEACDSVDLSSWGFNTSPQFHSLRYLTGAIDKVMALGGSYLINVGPDENGRITEDYACRIRAIGEWYTRLGGVLECHEADSRDYGVCVDKCIVNTKSGKTYFHFPEGLSTDTVIIKNFEKIPKKVRLVNTGAALEAKIERLPNTIGGFSTYLASEYLTFGKIPVDKLSSEAIVVEVEW